MNRPKKIHGNSLTGQQGINLIANVFGEMGFLWTPTSGYADAGIDGFVEIRKPDTGEATNMIIQVQSKATTKSWDNESVEGFEYRCDDRDIDYWMQGNAPVILVVSRPSDNEAYWVAVKEYFKNTDRRKSKKVRFNKTEHVFTAAAAQTLADLAAPQESGLYLGPPPVEERLCSNLLPVARHAQTIYIAETVHRDYEPIWGIFEERQAKYGKAWFLKDGKLISFYDLRSEPWKEVCDSTTTESFRADEWASSHDNERKNEFIRLLKLALADLLGTRAVRQWKPKSGPAIFHFAKTKDLTPRVATWKRIKTSQRTVFGPHYGKNDPSRIVYYRHLAFVPRFVRFGGQWYLEITPTYHFTSDGKKPSKYRESYLSGIKRIEKHAAVRGNVEFWASFLIEENLFSSPGLITFADLLEFETDFGIPEADWLNKADEEEKERLVQPVGHFDLIFE